MAKVDTAALGRRHAGASTALAAALGVLILIGPAARGASAAGAKATPKPCPPPAIVTRTLKQTIVKAWSNVVTYSDGQGIDGARRTCTYTTKDGRTISVILSAGAQVLAFVDAEDAASGAQTGYGANSHAQVEVVPVFGKGNDAWAAKNGGSLSALYENHAIVIDAPRTTIAQLVALAKATLGIPNPNQTGV